MQQKEISIVLLWLSTSSCDPALLAQLYWSSGSSFLCICNPTSWNWTAA